MKKSGKKLNLLDIAVISVLLIIIISTAVISSKEKDKPQLDIIITFVSDRYPNEVFEGIETDMQVFDYASGECMGVINNVNANKTEQGVSNIEITVLASVNEIENGFLINNTRFYKGQNLNIITADSSINAMISNFEKKVS